MVRRANKFRAIVERHLTNRLIVAAAVGQHGSRSASRHDDVAGA